MFWEFQEQDKLPLEEVSKTVMEHRENQEILPNIDIFGHNTTFKYKAINGAADTTTTDTQVPFSSIPVTRVKKCMAEDDKLLYKTNTINHESSVQNKYTKEQTEIMKKIEHKRLQALERQKMARYERLKVHLSQLLVIEEHIRQASTTVENEMKRSRP